MSSFDFSKYGNTMKEWKDLMAKKKAEQEVEKTEYYKFDSPVDPKNKHYGFAEGLTVPFINNCDGQRLNMYSSHFKQQVHLINPEYPKIFTNFENQVGEYSVSYKKADEDFTIIDKFQKNSLNYDLLTKTVDDVYDIIHFRKAKHITEEYGYGKIDCLENKVVGDKVHKGDYIYKTSNYDDEGNFGNGVNLLAAYYQDSGLTYEDAILISKSAAEKLKSYKCEETIISINGNDVLLNLYDTGEYKQYHSFPHVGESTLNNILVASRREDSQTLLYNFQYDKMNKIQPNDDITYTNGGIIADLDIYCNTPLDVLKKRNNEFTKEIIMLLEQQNEYYKKAAESMEKIVPVATEEELFSVMDASEKAAYIAEKKEYGFNWTRPTPKQILESRGIKYTEEFGYFWKQVHEYLDERIQWRNKGKSFQNFKIKFTILKENKITIGSKVSGLYGNKGVVSLIKHDEDMLKLPDGRYADIHLNSLGVPNRMNISQLYIQHINFMSDHVLAEMKKLDNVQDKLDLYFKYLKYLNKDQCSFIEGEVYQMNRAQQKEFVDEIEEKGIYVHEPPFYGNTSFETLKQIRIEHPEWCERYKCTYKGKDVERKLVIGDEYFIRLIISRLALIDGEFLRDLYTKYV